MAYVICQTESGNVRVRSDASLSSPVVDKCLRNHTYKLFDSTTKNNDGYSWLHIVGENGVDGWSVSDYFTAIRPVEKPLLSFTREELESVRGYIDDILSAQ